MIEIRIVYLATNSINGKRYVGQTILPLEKRIKRHLICKDTSMPFVSALKKYGIENFNIEPVAWCNDQGHQDFLEKFYIKYFNSKCPAGYNLTDGGYGGRKKGIPAWNKGLTKDTDVRVKSIGRKGRIPWDKGIPHSEEHKRRIGEARKDKKHSQETKEKIGLKHKNKLVSEETRKKLSISKEGSTMFPILKNEDWLRNKYIVECLSMREIAVIVGCMEETIRFQLHKLKIPIWPRTIFARKRRNCGILL